ncbi:hypothetical protein Tco_0194740 [Tanacetum coccineum]
MQLVQDKSKESCMNHKEQATSSRSGNDAPCDDEISDPYIFEEPMNAKQCNDIRPLPAKLTDKMTTELSDQSLESENVYITNQCESEQALDVSADISENRASRNFDLMINKWRLLKITLQAPFLNVQMTSVHIKLGIQDHSNEQSSSKAGPKVVPLAVKTATSRQELELLFTISYSNNLRTTGSRIKDSVRFSALTSYR